MYCMFQLVGMCLVYAYVHMLCLVCLLGTEYAVGYAYATLICVMNSVMHKSVFLQDLAPHEASCANVCT